MNSIPFPDIPCPKFDREPTKFNRSWNEIQGVHDLPHRMMNGDIVADSFSKTETGWGVQYRDGQFKMDIERKEASIWISEFFGNERLMTGVFPAKCDLKMFLKFYQRDVRGYDRVLGGEYEKDFPIRYIPMEVNKSTVTVSFFPDGFFQTLILPIPFQIETINKIPEFYSELAKFGRITLHGHIKCFLTVTNYLKGKCEDVPQLELYNFLHSLKQGYLPAQIPIWEGEPGNEALTTRRHCYLLFLTFPMRYGPRVLSKLEKTGLITKSNNEDLSFLVHTSELIQANQISGFTKNNSRRFFIPLCDDSESKLNFLLKRAEFPKNSVEGLHQNLLKGKVKFDELANNLIAKLQPLE